MTHNGARVALGAMVAVVALSIAYLLFGRERSIIEECSVVLEGSLQEGASLVTGGKGPRSLQLGFLRTSKGVVGEEQRLAFADCIHNKDPSLQVIDTRIRQPPEPLGAVAARWRGQGGIQLMLMPGGGSAELQNLRVSDFTGEKFALVRKICSRQGLGACVTCDPPEIARATTSVEIRLTTGAPVLKEKMDGKFPPPSQAVPLERYQLVDRSGDRWWYRCEPRAR